jgi:hypothetical protein
MTDLKFPLVLARLTHAAQVPVLGPIFPIPMSPALGKKYAELGVPKRSTVSVGCVVPRSVP